MSVRLVDIKGKGVPLDEVGILMYFSLHFSHFHMHSILILVSKPGDVHIVNYKNGQRIHTYITSHFWNINSRRAGTGDHVELAKMRLVGGTHSWVMWSRSVYEG